MTVAPPRQHAETEPGSVYADHGFSCDIIAWQRQHGRHALPWQQSREAYRVWLSEIMLQQTQVSAVIPYYQRFLESFPTVFSLAAASSEQVMSHWSGLGYYTRARNLHACAKRVVDEYDGVFPQRPELLADLPGIGRSTAAAIAAFSYGVRAAILDGNVKRVFARVFGITGYPSAKAVEDDLWRRAEALLPFADVSDEASFSEVSDSKVSDGHSSVRDASLPRQSTTNIAAYTQGLMDLGATVCTRSRPLCGVCPLQQRCVALASHRVAELPVRKPKKSIPVKQVMMLLLLDQNQVLLEQRPGSGIWGGLLSLPELPIATDPETIEHQLRHGAMRFGQVDKIAPLAKINHVFSHYKLEISPYLIALEQRATAMCEDTHVWYPVANLADAPLPAPIKKLLLHVAKMTLHETLALV